MITYSRSRSRSSRDLTVILVRLFLICTGYSKWLVTERFDFYSRDAVYVKFRNQ